METILLRVKDPNQDISAVQTAASVLRQGGLAAIPTETVYGLAANALNPKAVEKIFQAKGRPADNPLIVHIAELEQLPSIARNIPQAAYDLAEAFWPGPLTMILPKQDCIPDIVTAGLDTVTVRFPAEIALLGLNQLLLPLQTVRRACSGLDLSPWNSFAASLGM